MCESYNIAVKENGIWLPFGSGNTRERIATGITHSKTLPGGSSDLSFTMNGDSRCLPPGTQLQARCGWTPVWRGMVTDTPMRSTTDGIVTDVRAQGLVRHMQEDDAYNKWYVMSGLSGWQDARTFSVDPASFTTAYKVQTQDFGRCLIGLGRGVTASNNTTGSIILDMGPANTCKRIVLTYKAGGHASFDLVLRGDSSPGTAVESTTLDSAAIATGPTTTAYTFTTPQRYVRIGFTNASGGAVTPTTDTAWVQLYDIMVFTATAYESGNASILTASTIIADVVANSSAMPLVSTSTARIDATTTTLDDFITDGYESPYNIIERANRYESHQWFLTDEPTPVLVYRHPPTTPGWVLGQDDRYSFDGGGHNSLSEIYNKVRVRYRTTSGVESVTTVTLSPDNTLAGRAGVTRTKDIEVSHAANSTTATAIANAFLALQQYAPLSGRVTITGSMRTTSGARYEAALVNVGDVILLADQRDPQTGALGRSGIVSAIEYDVDSATATFTLDSDRGLFEVMLDRFEAGIGLNSRW